MNTDVQLSPHFNLAEFLHEGGDKEVTPEIVENLRKLAQRLEAVRALIGKPLRITSGFRTMAHHLEIYRQKGITDKRKIPMGSWHLKGLAADFVVDGMTADQVRAKIGDSWNGGVELGITWVHLDLGPKRRFYA